jgi:hypothetical protein
MTVLHQRKLEHMQIYNFSENTRESYLLPPRRYGSCTV